MGLAEVRAAITRNAQAQAEAILTQARADAAAIVKTAQERITTEQAVFDSETAVMVDILERRAMSSANARAKGVVLDAKRRALDATVEAARQALAELSGARREALLERLCEEVVADGVTARFRAAAQDVKTLVRVFPKATVVADPSIRGGFIASTDDGSIAVNQTFDRLLASVYEQELLAVSQTLFEDKPPKSGGNA